MKRHCFSALVLIMVGCTPLPDWSLFSSAQGGAGLTAPSQFHFGWHISGDQETAPLQVFDDGQAVWLQFASTEYTPALFARTTQGLIPLAFRRQGPYVTVEGIWSVLITRGGALQTVLERVSATGPGTEQSLANDGSSTTAVWQEEADSIPQIMSPRVLTPEKDLVDSVLLVEAPPDPSGDSSVIAATSTGPKADSVDSVMAPEVVEAYSMAVAVEAVTLPQQEPAVYQVGPKDQNMRLTLERWARAAGWTFQTEHWVVEVDIPIVGEASFAPPFQSAVQQMLSSTEMADRPLQPCFYSNKVLRVVPYAQVCDRRSLPGAT